MARFTRVGEPAEMNVLGRMVAGGYEQVVFCQDRTAGLRAVIALHDTTLGPALGGVRLAWYEGEEAAVVDALGLARAMTCKAALAGLSLGGGKTAVLGPPPPDRAGMFRALGRAVDGLGGRYIPTEDFGTTVADLLALRETSRFGVGLPPPRGGGDPSPMTARGVLQGIRACLEAVFGSDALAGRRVAIQGVGKVGAALARMVAAAGAEVVVADVDPRRVADLEGACGARRVRAERVLEAECEVLCPCARGGVLNAETIPRLRCRIVAGAANNQLADEMRDGDALAARGIVYAPDYAINAGGLINVADELEPGGYSSARAAARTDAIRATVARILAMSRERREPPHRVALALVEERLAAARRSGQAAARRHQR